MVKVGLTGGIGSGKSTVARVFEVLGIAIYHADERARALMAERADVRDALVARFGPAIFKDGGLDRAGLASIIFEDEAALQAVNAIVHPAVRVDFDHWALQQEGPYVIMEAALMAENEGWKRFDRVITVACPEQERIKRVMLRDAVSEEQVRARMQHQATDEARAAIAHFVIRNNGSELVIPQVLAIDAELRRLQP
ncbi:MAG TPA: dephospho-CoA kinase [Flavobacteriales bacterium]|nr:dephospho-CoA kinase [Flavobacteriales bacterium]